MYAALQIGRVYGRVSAVSVGRAPAKRVKVVPLRRFSTTRVRRVRLFRLFAAYLGAVVASVARLLTPEQGSINQVAREDNTSFYKSPTETERRFRQTFG